jgi:cobalt-zinc-cadmium efflux system outer membrane protein
VDQASLGLLLERSTRITAVRQGYFEVLALQRRVEILEELIRLSEETVRASKKLLDAQQIAKAELIQLEIEFERTRAERDAARSELPAAFRKLAAQVGVPRLPERTVLGSIEELPPEYDLTAVREQILAVHPEIRSAQVGIDKALLLLRRAEAEARPNVTVGANFVRQGQNDSNDFGVNVSLPLPLWNRNEGSIQAAQAQLGEAHRQVARVENELTERLANSFATYTAARQRAQRYRDAILPKARESHQLTLRAFQAGQFESLKVLQSQKAIAEANLEYNRASGDLWRSASEIAGLLLEEAWPTSLATAPKIEE